MKYGEIVKNGDGYNVGGFVNLGACAMTQGQLEQAKSYFLSALECDPSHFESLYNLGGFNRTAPYIVGYNLVFTPSNYILWFKIFSCACYHLSKNMKILVCKNYFHELKHPKNLFCRKSSKIEYKMHLRRDNRLPLHCH